MYTGLSYCREYAMVKWSSGSESIRCTGPTKVDDRKLYRFAQFDSKDLAGNHIGYDLTRRSRIEISAHTGPRPSIGERGIEAVVPEAPGMAGSRAVQQGTSKACNRRFTSGTIFHYALRPVGEGPEMVSFRGRTCACVP